MACIHLTHLLFLTTSLFSHIHTGSCFFFFFALYCTRSVLYILPGSCVRVLLLTPTKWLLSGSISLPCFSFCTVSLCSHHKTSSVLHPRLSICAMHVCCFTAVTEAHILIAARWGKTSYALTHMHDEPPDAHTDSTRMHSGFLWRSAAYRWHLIVDNLVIGQLCVFLLVFFAFLSASGPLLQFPGVKRHISQ